MASFGTRLVHCLHLFSATDDTISGVPGEQLPEEELRTMALDLFLLGFATGLDDNLEFTKVFYRNDFLTDTLALTLPLVVLDDRTFATDATDLTEVFVQRHDVNFVVGVGANVNHFFDLIALPHDQLVFVAGQHCHEVVCFQTLFCNTIPSHQQVRLGVLEVVGAPHTFAVRFVVVGDSITHVLRTRHGGEVVCRTQPVQDELHLRVHGHLDFREVHILQLLAILFSSGMRECNHVTVNQDEDTLFISHCFSKT